VLAELLAIAGSPVTVEDVKSLFSEAFEEHEEPGAVFPDLFEEEPRFPSPEVARRLYANLFGLWDRISAQEFGEPTVGKPVRPTRSPPMPRPPPIEGWEIPADYIEQVFQFLTRVDERERRKLRDRFDQRETALIDAIQTLALPPASEELGLDLAFELWAMAELALGKRVGRARFGKLREPNPEPSGQTALESYLTEWLDEATLDDEDPLPAQDRQALERVLLSAISQLASKQLLSAGEK
jgi:hypothetical protein